MVIKLIKEVELNFFVDVQFVVIKKLDMLKLDLLLKLEVVKSPNQKENQKTNKPVSDGGQRCF